MKNSFVVPFNISDYLPRNIKEISKDLRVPINEDYLNEIRSMASYASSNVLNTFPPESIKELRRSVKSLSASYVPSMDSSSSLRKSLNNFSSMITSNIHQPISSQMFDDTLASMRYYTSTNNHIKLQWKNLINIQLDNNFIDSFTDPSNISKYSKAMGISENDLKAIQKSLVSSLSSFYSDNKNDNSSIDNERDQKINLVKERYTYSPLKNGQSRAKNNHDDAKDSHLDTSKFIILLFLFLIPTILKTDGSNRNNKLETQIGDTLNTYVPMFYLAKEESKK